MPKTCLLHIGKTGGTYLKSIIEHNEDHVPKTLAALTHYDTVFSTRKKYGKNRNIAFVFRDPEKRFCSGFVSRIRQGRPTYNSIWSAEEAIAFQWFATPNALAEALGSDDERTKSAAHFAMQNIRHIRLGYKHFLGSPKRLELENSKGRLKLCVELEQVDDNITEVMEAIGLNTFDLPPKPTRHRNTYSSIDRSLSDIGKANLRAYWAQEFEIFDYCKSIATIPADAN